MKEEYWDRFTDSGRIEDYLNYKGMLSYEQGVQLMGGTVIGEEEIERISKHDGDDIVCRTDWRI